MSCIISMQASSSKKKSGCGEQVVWSIDKNASNSMSTSGGQTSYNSGLNRQVTFGGGYGVGANTGVLGNTNFQEEGVLAQTRADRVRLALFPETIEEEDGKSIVSTRIGDGKPTIVQRLAESCEMLKHAIVNLINYQDDAVVSTRAVPELVKLMSDEDQVVVAKAIVVIYQLSKKEASRHAIMNNNMAMSSLIDTINKPSDAEVTKNAVGTLNNLSHHQQGLLALFKGGGIKGLIKCLLSPHQKVLDYAISTLRNMMLHQEGSILEIRLSGGIQKMVALLRKNEVRFLTYVVDCLHILAFGNQEGKLVIVASRGPLELMRILQTYDYEKLIWATCRLLKVLSVCPNNKSAIVEDGGIIILGPFLDHYSPRVVTNVLWTLQNLSDVAANAEGLKPTLRALTKLLHSDNEIVLTCATAILANLTCNADKNKTIVVQAAGVDALVRLIHFAPNHCEITESALRTLRHITFGHKEAELAQNQVRLFGGVSAIVQFLAIPTHWPWIKAVIGLIRNLAQAPTNQNALREQNVIQYLAQSLVHAYNDIRHQNKMKGSASYMDRFHSPMEGLLVDMRFYAPTEGVRMEDVMLAAVSAFHFLAREPYNRPLIRAQNVVKIFVNLLYNDIEYMQLVSSGVICELAHDREGALLAEMEGATEPLRQLLYISCEAIVAYVASSLYRMAEDKPMDYRKRLEVDIAAALVRTTKDPVAFVNSLTKTDPEY